jgi:hypothetical protein
MSWHEDGVQNLAKETCANTKYRGKLWGFTIKKVWTMGFERVMGFGVFFSGNQLGGHKNVWDLTGYGLGQV